MKLCELVHEWALVHDLLGADIALAHRCHDGVWCVLYIIWQDLSQIVATIGTTEMSLYDGHSYSSCHAEDPKMFEKLDEAIALALPHIVPNDVNLKVMIEILKARAQKH